MLRQRDIGIGVEAVAIDGIATTARDILEISAA
jgi:hypothetical protein